MPPTHRWRQTKATGDMIVVRFAAGLTPAEY